jgi:hypothetical protein
MQAAEAGWYNELLTGCLSITEACGGHDKITFTKELNYYGFS